MGVVHVSYQLAGSAIDVLRSLPNDWTLVTYDPFKRTYTYGDFEITIVGDFGSQTNSLTDETQIFFIEYFNTVTGEGARISGINNSAGSIISIADAATHNRVVFSASDQADNIYISEAMGSSVNAYGGDDFIYASSQTDVIDGGSGNDKIIGSGGKDIMTGGQGKDVFRYLDDYDTYINHPVFFGNAIDRIRDFSTKDDHFDFRKFYFYDFKSGDDGYADFTFIGRRHFTMDGDELRFVQTLDRNDNPVTFLYGNLDGDKQPEIAIRLDGDIRLRADDFYL